jgi:hypothetical protein
MKQRQRRRSSSQQRRKGAGKKLRTKGGILSRGIAVRIGGLAGGSGWRPHNVTCGAAVEVDPTAGTRSCRGGGVRRPSLLCHVRVAQRRRSLGT